MRRLVTRWAEIGTRPAPRSWWLALFAFCMIVLVLQGALIGGLITNLRQSDDLAHRTGLVVRETDALAHRTSVIVGETSLIAKTLTRDEHATCVIQNRGLSVTRELTIVMADVHALLTVPPSTPAARAQAAQTPPRVREIVNDLTEHLQAFTRLESDQPKARHC